MSVVRTLNLFPSKTPYPSSQTNEEQDPFFWVVSNLLLKKKEKKNWKRGFFPPPSFPFRERNLNLLCI
jgi:hypothetical protein